MRSDSGLTMVEIIAGMTAMAAIALAVWIMFKPFDSVLFTIWRRGGSAQAEAAVSRMIAEIERCRSSASITNFASTRFTCTDIDGGTVDISASGSDLLLGGDVLARGVESLSFEYLDEDGAAASQASDIRIVRMTVAISSSGQIVRLRSDALIRNQLGS